MSTATADSAGLSAMLQEQAGRLFTQHVKRASLAEADGGAWPAALWAELEAAGLPLALATEEAGGIGLSPVDAMGLVRLAAYHCVPLPLAETILAQGLWTRAGGMAVAGAITIAADMAPLAIEAAADGAALRGQVEWVSWASEAAHVLLQARDSDGTLQLVLQPTAGLRVSSVRNLAGEPRARVDFDGTVVAPGCMRAAPSGTDLFLLGACLRAQQMVGAMQRCLDDSVAYANTRTQFGRPIGKFQAVQHMLAQAAMELGAAIASADQAAEAFGTASGEFAVPVAKARCGEAAGKVAGIAHQVHAAMGFTQELPLHFATRRLWAWREEFGAEAYWEDVIGRRVTGAGGEALWALLVGE